MCDNKDLVRFDWAIKRLLRHKADHTILNGFLSSLLGQSIKIDRILESEGNKEDEENKSNRVDILAEDADGKKIIIEVQNETENSYFHRMLFGTSKIINDYLQKGQSYDKVTKVYSINIVYFKLGEGTDYIYHGTTEFRGVHNHDLLQLSPLLKEKFKVNKLSEIFPEYYILKVNDFDRYAVTPLEQWMYFLRNSRLPENADAPGLKEAAEELRICTLPLEERRAYEKYIDTMLSLEDVVDSAWYNGHYEGREEGKVLGREEGKALGREEGKNEALMAVAKTMKQSGVSLAEISKFTGLSLDQLQNI
ncbi:MAG: Rpn family recombination-promoting nuclease/putative transposase [Muribaculaceae bacterium]|nr:Rpn family recombination-promoting nuclease/putative transposase [Muribaculaceae bacterium]